MKLLGIVELLRSKAAKRIAYGALIILIIVDFIVPRHEIHFFGDKIPGFWSLFGLIACVLIIIVSKWIGHMGLMKDENYYDE